MSPEPELTPAERAVAVALADWHNAHSSTSRLAVGAFTAEARAVVAAVRPLIAAETLEETTDVLDRFAALKAREPVAESHRRGRTLSSGIEAAANLVRKHAALRTTTPEENR